MLFGGRLLEAGREKSLSWVYVHTNVGDVPLPPGVILIRKKDIVPENNAIMRLDGTESCGSEIFPWWQHLAYVFRVVLSDEKYLAPHLGHTWSIRRTSWCCLRSCMVSCRAFTRLWCMCRRS